MRPSPVRLLLPALLLLSFLAAPPAQAILGKNPGVLGGKPNFNTPFGVAAANGMIFVADYANDRIQVFDPVGNLQVKWGEKGSGDGQFRGPAGVAVDAAGNVYVADSGNNRIQVFHHNGAFLRTLTGPLTTPLTTPFGVAVDTAGCVYVADTGNNRVVKFDASGVPVGIWSGFAGPKGIAVDGSGNVYVADTNRIRVFDAWGASLRDFGAFNRPVGIAFGGPGHVFVAETGSHRIQRVDESGIFIESFGGYGTGDGQFLSPAGVAASDGKIYVADQDNHRVQVLSVSTPVMSFVAKWGIHGSDNGQFVHPIGLAVDRHRNVYVTEWGNNRIQVFGQSGQHLVTWGSKGSGVGEFRGPEGVAVDATGNIVYVADTGNDRIQQRYNGSWGPFGAGVLSPKDVAVGADDSVYVVETGGNRIRMLDGSGVPQGMWGTGSGNVPFRVPQGVAVDVSNNVYVADTGNGRVEKYDNTGWGNVAAGLSTPTRVAVDGQGRIYVADMSSDRIRVFDASGEPLKDFGATGPDEGEFDSPKGVALDFDNNGYADRVYVADFLNHRVQFFDAYDRDGDGVDEGDCDDLNPTFTNYRAYPDGDGDGFGDHSAAAQEVCNFQPGDVDNDWDCNDSNDSVNPGKQESCNGVDDDCDGQIDQGLPKKTYYHDEDGDGFGDPDDSRQDCAAPPEYVDDQGDCDDGRGGINPNTVWYRDADNDGYSDGMTATQCLQPGGFRLAGDLTATSGDCNDGDPAVNLAPVWYRDADNDGYSDGVTATQCLQPTGYRPAASLTSVSGDCRDDVGSAFPGGIEVCDGIDNDCDGQVDEGLECTPVVGEIACPVALVPVGTAVSVSATVSGSSSFTATWTWEDGSASTETFGNGTVTVTGSHAYAIPGVYTVTLTVTGGGGSANKTFQYVVAYDPKGGFVTGAGWIDSPAGAYAAEPSLAGKATFGFVSKYLKGATVPTGETEFRLTVANLSFRSTAYQWLVVSGPKGQFKGDGSINGQGGYGFLLTANDGQAAGGGGVDRFRIKIWDKSSGAAVYDNQPGAGDDAAAATALGGGSVVIHAK